MTVDDILTEIVAEVVSDLSNAEMLVYFKSGARMVPTYMRGRLFLTEDTLTIASGSQEGDLTDLDPGFIRERNVWYVDSNNERVPIVKPPSPSYFHTIYTASQSQGSGKPDYYRIFQQTIQMDRKADAALTVGLDYFFAVTTGITTSTDLEFDEQLIEALKCFCKYLYYLQYEQEDVMADTFKKDGFALIGRLDEEYQDHEFGGIVEETETY